MHHVLVVCAAVFVAFCNYGILQAYGALFTDTLEKYGEGRAKTSLVHSLLAGTSLGAGVIAGYLIKRFNLTVVSTIGSVLLPLGFMASYFATSVMFLLISIGVVSGLGVSFSYVSAVVVLGTVISEKHKTFALSLQNVACGLPGVVVPYLYVWLTQTFTLSGTFLIYGGITLNNLAASIIFNGVKLKVPGPIESDKCKAVTEIHTTVGDKGSQSIAEIPDRSLDYESDVTYTLPSLGGADHYKISERALYVVFMNAVAFVMVTIGGYQTIYQDIGVFKGLSAEQTLSCISAFNIASTVGRFFPLIFQIVSPNPFLSPLVSSLSGVLGQGILLMTSHYYTTMIGYVLSGLTDGGVSASVSVVIYKILSPERQTMGFGLILTLRGILVTASGPVYGAIFDQTESYSLVLSITTVSIAIGSVFFGACFFSYGNLCCRRTKQCIMYTN